MNVTFRLPTTELEQKFIQESLSQGMGGLKGHRSVADAEHPSTMLFRRSCRSPRWLYERVPEENG